MPLKRFFHSSTAPPCQLRCSHTVLPCPAPRNVTTIYYDNYCVDSQCCAALVSCNADVTDSSSTDIFARVKDLGATTEVGSLPGSNSTHPFSQTGVSVAFLDVFRDVCHGSKLACPTMDVTLYAFLSDEKILASSVQHLRSSSTHRSALLKC